MNKEYFNIDEWALRNGLSLKINVSFIKDKNQMSMISCSVNDGYNCHDYAFSPDITIAEIIKEFLDNN